MATSPPPSYALSISDEDKNGNAESECDFLMVALCPCLVCFILILIKVRADTINCLLDTLGRAKLGKEAQTLFEKLKGTFTVQSKEFDGSRQGVE